MLSVAATICYLISFCLPFSEDVYGVQLFIYGMFLIMYPPAWLLAFGWLANPIAWYLAFHKQRTHQLLTSALFCSLCWNFVIVIRIAIRDDLLSIPGPAFWLWEFSLWLIVIRQRFLPVADWNEDPDLMFAKYRVEETIS